MRDLSLPLLAIVAGLISFTSPCALPLVPSYLSYISGLPVAELSERGARRVVLMSTIAFVGGFTVIFTALGASSSFFGLLLIHDLPVIIKFSGALIILIGLSTMGLFRIPWLARERRFDFTRVVGGPRGAFPLGMAFAFGWTPCIGPILASILAVAGASQTVVEGAALLALYSMGLGIPFVLLAIGFSRVRNSVSFLKRHGRVIEFTGGFLLVVIGVLFISGAWKTLFIPLQVRFARLGWPPL